MRKKLKTAIVGGTFLISAGLFFLLLPHPPFAFSKTLPDGTTVKIVRDDHWFKSAPASDVCVVKATISAPPNQPSEWNDISCFFRINGKVIEPTSENTEYGTSSTFYFPHSEFPLVCFEAKIGFATGKGVLNKSLSTLDPKDLDLPNFADNDAGSAMIFVPWPIATTTKDRILRPIDQNGKPVPFNGFTGRNLTYPIALVYVEKGQKVVDLPVYERNIQWYDLDWQR